MWREVARRSLWLGAGSAAGRLLPFAVLVLLGRRLASTEFASVSVGFAWIGVAAALTTSGLANVAAQRLAPLTEPHEQAPIARRVLRLGAALSLVLALLLLAGGRRAAAWAFGGTVDSSVVAPAVIAGAAWCLVTLAVAILNGLHQPRTAAAVLGLGGLLQGAGLASGHLAASGASGALWGLACGNVLALAWAARHLAALMPGPAGRRAAAMPGFGAAAAWSTLAAACVMPVTFAAGSLVSHGPDGAKPLAAFHALEQLHQLLIYLPGILGQALLPVLALHLSQDPAKARRLVRVALAMALAGSAVAAALAWDPSWLHALVRNPAISDDRAVRSMLLNAGLSVSLALLGGGLLARGQYAVATLMNVGWAAVFLGFGWAWKDAGAAGPQSARLLASWLLVLAASAVLWSALPVRTAPARPAASRGPRQ